MSPSSSRRRSTACCWPNSTLKVEFTAKTASSVAPGTCAGLQFEALRKSPPAGAIHWIRAAPADECRPAPTAVAAIHVLIDRCMMFSVLFALPVQEHPGYERLSADRQTTNDAVRQVHVWCL